MVITTIGLRSYQIGKDLLEEQSSLKLTAVKESKAQQIEAYFGTIRNQVLTLSEDLMVVEAMSNFKRAFHEGDSLAWVHRATEGRRRDAIKKYYDEEFYTRLTARNANLQNRVEEFIPESGKISYWQYLYIAGNEHPTGEKLELMNAGDGSRYSAYHEKYHPAIKSFLEKFGYYDIFLVDHETGNIVYSVFKEVDYGTSLLTGPYSTTNFGEVFQSMSNARDKDEVKLVDFKPYSPSYFAPASFIASPIFDGDKQVGVLIFQMPVDEINHVLTSNENWSQTGMGLSGETYLVGADNKMRSISRFLLEDPENYFIALQNAGYPQDEIDAIRNQGTSILYQTIETESVNAASMGNSGRQIIADYRGVEVLSSYKPLAIEDVHWSIISEIDTSEAFAPIDRLMLNILFSALALMVIVIVIGILFARYFIRPINRLKEAAEEVAGGNNNIQIPVTSTDEVGQLSGSFNAMVRSIRDASEKIAQEKEQTVAALKQAQQSKANAEKAMKEALASKKDAEEAQERSEVALRDAEAAKAEAMEAQQRAEASKAEVEQALKDAEAAQAEALAEKEKATASEQEAARAMQEALASKSAAEEALAEADKAKSQAETALQEAERSKAEAVEAQQRAEASKAEVEVALQDAEKAKAEALESKEKAEQSQAEALVEKEKANASEQEAARAMEEALASKTKAETALVEADRAKQVAEASKEEAEQAMKELDVAQQAGLKARQELEASVELMLEKMNLFAGGDLTTHLPEHSNTSINRLFDGFNKAVSSVRGLIENVNHTLRETREVVKKIKMSSGYILEDARKQSDQATGIAAASEEMTQTIAVNAQAASSAADLSKASGEVARDGGAIIKEAVVVIKDIAKVLKESEVLFDRLRNSSGQIGTATSVIETIAGQTKLLALNARIEAEHAAEKGAGFAVVAKEVRQLAEKTTESTLGISDMVEGVQNDTRQAVKSMNTCLEIAERGVALADKALQAINEIDSKVYETVGMANQIAQAAVDQTTASNEISQNIVTISDLSQKSQDQVQDIVSSVENLSQQTEKLSGLVGTFKTGANQAVLV